MAHFEHLFAVVEQVAQFAFPLHAVHFDADSKKYPPEHVVHLLAPVHATQLATESVHLIHFDPSL